MLKLWRIVGVLILSVLLADALDARPTVSREEAKRIVRVHVDDLSYMRARIYGLVLTVPEKQELVNDILRDMERTRIYRFVD